MVTVSKGRPKGPRITALRGPAGLRCACTLGGTLVKPQQFGCLLFKQHKDGKKEESTTEEMFSSVSYVSLRFALGSVVICVEFLPSTDSEQYPQWLLLMTFKPHPNRTFRKGDSGRVTGIWPGQCPAGLVCFALLLKPFPSVSPAWAPARAPCEERTCCGLEGNGKVGESAGYFTKDRTAVWTAVSSEQKLCAFSTSGRRF